MPSASNWSERRNSGRCRRLVPPGSRLQRCSGWSMTRPSLAKAGFIMERLEGETIPRRFLREPRFERARGKAAYQLGEILGRLQAMDYSGLELKETPAGEHPALQQLDEYAGFLDELDDPRPAFELGLRWLRDHVPASWRPGLVHGDFRNGNLMFDESGVLAVLDWELVHPGDPMEDVGWLCVRSWRYGNADKPVGGFGSRDGLVCWICRDGRVRARQSSREVLGTAGDVEVGHSVSAIRPSVSSALASRVESWPLPDGLSSPWHRAAAQPKWS